MTKTSDEKSSKLKPYQMILLSCILAAFMIINSNNVNYNRDLAKLNKEKGELFDRIINTRRLSSSSSQTYSAEICERGSDDLKEYYQKGDPKIIDIDPHKSIECEEKDETYMKALINIVRTIADDTEEDSDADTHSGSDPAPDDGSGDGTGGDGTGGHRRNLRNLGGVSDIDQQDLTDYAMRFLPMAVFLVFGILSIFGWIFCCICCCCDCCCCCCLKKTSCKVPCFIFTYVFYGLVVGISLYGLIQSNKIFVGLADTECSILKFFEQVLHGEIKQTKPYWAGIERIKELLGSLKTTINEMKGNAEVQLNDMMDSGNDPDKAPGLEQIRTDFLGSIKEAGNKFFIENTEDYKAPYVFPDPNSDPKYIYDMVYSFGRYEEGTGYTNPSYLYAWDQEFSIIDGEAYGYLTDVQGDFNDILDDNIIEVNKGLQSGIDNLDDLTSPFTDANDEIGKILSNYSESIDSYGKMSVKIIFGGLMAMNVALAALMLLICMFSGKSCTSCCCCRCLFKFCTHILWNVLALMMILSFIFGSLIALVGRLGGDAMGLVSYIMSKENFQNTNNPLFVDKLGKAKDYIKTCLHEDGDIAKKLNLGTSFDSFTEINDVQSDISNVKSQFENLKNQRGTYDEINDKFNAQFTYTEDITMYLKGSLTEKISFSSSLQKINEILETCGKKDRWYLDSENTELECKPPSDAEGQNYNPKKCKPYQMDSYYSGCGDYTTYSNYLKVLDDFIGHASGTSVGDSDNAPSFMHEVRVLKGKYDTYLTFYVNILGFVDETIGSITDLIHPYTGDNGEAFSFINGKFIGINLRIILKYFKHSLGGDFFTVGICLCVVGLSLILSISSTIILIVIINIGLKEAIEQNKMINNPGTAVSPFEGVPNMPKPPY